MDTETTDNKKRGRTSASIWKIFTDDNDPHLSKSARCRNCKETVNYHRKSELVKAHLLKCAAFRKCMMGTDIADRPEWFQKDKKLKSVVGSASSGVASGSTSAGPSNSNSSSRQLAITQYVLPPMTAKLNSQFQEAMALHYYVSGTAFQRIEDRNLAKAISILRPDAHLPDRKKLGGDLLDKCYMTMKKQIDTYLKSSSSCVCIITDGWSNIRNEPIVNYMASSPAKTVFLESVATGTQGHTAEWISSDIERIITKFKDTTFAGAVTDNTSANKNAWKLLKDKYPTMFFHGCVSHGLNLMVKDIFAASKTKKAGQLEATYPDDYPFEEMLQLAADCKDLVKFFHNHHVMKTKLTQMQAVNNLNALAQPAPTRWGTLQQCFKTILNSERIIYSIVSERDFVVGTTKQKAERLRLKNIVIKDSFIEELKKALTILEPIDALIVKFQSDSIPVSEVLLDFNMLPTKFAAMTISLTSSEIKYLEELSAKRFQFMYGDAHGLGYLLDPRFIGDGLSADHRREVEDVLAIIPENDQASSSEERKMELYDQLTKYVIAARREKSENTIRYKMLEMKRKTPLQFWQADGADWPELQKIAVKIFSMSTSSASSERNFSTYGFIHSKLRNSLSQDSVDKLVFIKTNFTALNTAAGDNGFELLEASEDESNEQSEQSEAEHSE
jgi:hypothetical protein